MLTEPQKRQLQEQGYLVFPALLSPPQVAEFNARVEELFALDGDGAGSEFKTSANPHNGCAQPLHVDSGALPDSRGNSVCNSVWLLDDFTERNGALRVVPGSHLWGRAPEPGAKPEGEMLITGKAGDVIVMNAHMWHGGSENFTDRQRRAMHVYYTRGDKPQQQYQKRLVRAEVQDRISPLGRRLLALDDPLNDELSAAGSGMSGFMK